MPPTPVHTPRLVLYQQTHHTPTGEPISILPLVTNRTGITHLYIAAIHINDPPGNITLNDHSPDDPRFTQLWEEVKWLQGTGVKVMGMLGGAAQGSFVRLSGDEASFEAYYGPLASLIRSRSLDGIDLDIEEAFALSSLTRLLQRLKSDFGSSFIITLAPVAPALIPLRPYLTSLCQKLLNPTTQHSSLPSVIRAFLKPGILKTREHLSGFNHLELEASDAGKLIDWYNVQLYNGWGDARTTQLYDLIVATGWKPQRVVLGVLTNPGNGGSGHVSLDRLKSVVEGLVGRYGRDFGGVMGWEYFNAGMEKGDAKGPWEWVTEVGSVFINPATQQAAVAGGLTASAVLEGLRNLQIPGNVTTSQGERSGRVEQATEGTSAASGTSRFPDEHITRLVELGFDRAEAIAALEAMDGDVDRAAELLFGE